MTDMSLANELKSERYQPIIIDLENKNSSHSLVIELTGRNKLVLEIGTSTGYITKILKELGNSVIGVEIDKEAGEIAKTYCESTIIGDVEELDLDSYIDPASIDVIMLADLLEHLRWPGRFLGKIKKYLKPDGYLVVSLPNVSHGDLLLNLLNGDFKYTSSGLLDETHLRFFGRKNIIDIFNKYGYEIKDLQYTKMPIGSTELKLDLNKISLELLKFIEALPDSDVYQFVFKAVPSINSSNETISKNVNLNRYLSKYTESIVKQYESEIQSMSEQIQYRDAQIAEIKKSVIWQIMERFHNDIVERALPQGTRRRRWYNLGMKSARRIFVK